MRKSFWLILVITWFICITLNILICFSWLVKIQEDLREHQETLHTRGVWMKSVDKKLDSLLPPEK